MKILVVASGQSIWTAKYIEKVLIPLGCKVTLLTPGAVAPAFHHVYAKPSVRVVHQVGPHRLLAKIPYLRRLSLKWRTAALIAERGGFDVIHVHFASLAPTRLAFMMRGRRRVISYWGSDLLRRPPDQLVAMERFLSKAEVVTVNSTVMKAAFVKQYGHLGVSPTMIPFGVNGLDAIDALRNTESKSRALNRFDLPLDRVIVTVGYNGRREQQQLMILEAIGGLPVDLKARMHVVAPMTYGGDDSFVHEVREALDGTGCQGTVLTEFLNEQDQARLAVATDLFIHAQATDALSATLQEFIFAGATVLNGSWLKYPELSNAGVVMHEFTTREDLTELMASFLSSGIPPELEKENREAMWSRSWDAVADRWAAIYGH